MAAGKSDRKFMEMAVEQMRKSRSEHADKRDPLVGAVLVGSDGKLMAETYRGELRVGDHAEFTLIERYLGNKNLEGATIYVTLEPCIRRNPPKKPCAAQIVKARIGRALVGMTDPNPDICGRGITHLQTHGVEVGFFDNDLAAEVRGTNREFIDYWEAHERKISGDMHLFEGPSAKELEVVERASVKNLSQDAVTRYLRQRGMNMEMPSSQALRILEMGGYVGRTKKGKPAPTVAGVVLFAETPADILPQCRISIETLKAGSTVSGDFEGPLIGFRDHLDRFFKDNMRYFTEIRQFERVKVAEYPSEALREAAFNAVVHRDYQAGSRVHVTLKDTEVEVRSPGGLLKPISLNQVREFRAPPYSRNPHIALALQRMGWIEEKGTGLGRMRDSMIAHGLRAPFFEMKDGYLIVTLPGQAQAWSGIRVSPDFLATLENREQMIVALVMSKARVATRDCAKALRVDVATARRYLRALVGKGVLIPRGSGPRLMYQLSGVE